MAFRWHTLDLGEHAFARRAAACLDPGSARALLDETHERFTRAACNGLVTVTGTIGGRTVGVASCDFRVRGGSFGAEASARLGGFVRSLELQRAPLVLQLHTLGVRFMEGRTVFAPAFGLLPEIARFAEKNLLVTCVGGSCLGLGALLFGLGHYRIGVTGKALNLTGPEVMRMFFGETFDFDTLAAVDRQIGRTDLVQEVVADDEALTARVRALLSFRAATPSESRAKTAPSRAPSLVSTVSTRDRVEGASRPAPDRLAELVARVGDGAHEIFPDASSAVRAFIVRRHGRPLGVLANPPGRRDNLVTVAVLRRYANALDLFGALGMPVVSMIDTPGADPRVEQTDQNVVGAILDVGKRILRYPHGLMGIVIGRCFGGASILGFPKTFGARRVVALDSARAGIMDARILSHLLAGSPRLLEEWREVAKTETADLSDLVAAGVFDAVVGEPDVGREVDRFLHDVDGPIATPLRVVPLDATRPSRRRVSRLPSRNGGTHR